MTKEEMYAKIHSEDEWVVGALITIHSNQTADEQGDGVTRWENGVGFNGVDAPILTSIANFYLSKGFLTKKQLDLVKKKIGKYVGQLLTYGVEPLPLRKGEAPVEFGQKKLWAGSLNGGEKIQIKFWFPQGDNGFKIMLGKIKSLPGRKWNPDSKTWTVPTTVDVVESLIDWGYELGESLEKWYKKQAFGKVEDEVIEGLYPFQSRGVSFIESRKGRIVLGDDPGLGKTIQALAWLKKSKAFPAIIVVPANVKINWERETRKWVPDAKIVLLSGREKKDVHGEFETEHSLKCIPLGVTEQHLEFFKEVKPDVFIINYDIVPNKTKKERIDGKMKVVDIPNTGWVDLLRELKAKTLIIDECHYIKNRKTLRTKAIKILAQGIKNVIAMSGTPIISRPVEFYETLALVDPARFGNFWAYAKRYCGATKGTFGWDFSGATNTEELHGKLVGSVMIRRLKRDVLQELPEKQRSVLPIELSNRKEYNWAADDLEDWLEENFGEDAAESAMGAEALVRFEKLKQLAVEGKMKAATEWIEDFLESGNKLVVFATHHKTINQLTEAFGERAVKLDGRDSQEKKQEAIDRFQNDDSIKLFIGNIKAAGVGITLTASSNVAFVELGWNPGEHDQAEDRVHRIGQDDSVNVWYLLASDTIEEDIADLLDEKRKVLTSVLDGESVDSDSVLRELIKKVRK